MKLLPIFGALLWSMTVTSCVVSDIAHDWKLERENERRLREANLIGGESILKPGQEYWIGQVNGELHWFNTRNPAAESALGVTQVKGPYKYKPAR
jgi:hypothetical protein